MAALAGFLTIIGKPVTYWDAADLAFNTAFVDFRGMWTYRDDKLVNFFPCSDQLIDLLFAGHTTLQFKRYRPNKLVLVLEYDLIALKVRIFYQ